MKKLIDFKIYDTETSAKISTWKIVGDRYAYELYKTKNGRYFIYWYGQKTKEENISPLSEKGAKKWLISYHKETDYIKEFGEFEEA